MVEVSIRQARERLSDLIAAVQRGESVTITRRGHKVASLTAIADDTPRRLPSLADFRATFRPRGKPLSQIVRDARDAERA